MAFDGIVIANLVKEFKETILNSRISKIAQPEKDELLLTLKMQRGQIRLLISASASLPLIYLTDQNKLSPKTAPNFCMLLRKHISNGRIVSICQPDMERIIHFEIEHTNELGDLCKKILVVEIMGKHSNIIFCKEDLTIIDSMKHISAQVSSIREVLPGRHYFVPATTPKFNPLRATADSFLTQALNKPLSIMKAIYQTYTGISPSTASEICFRASIDGDLSCHSLTEEQKLHLFQSFHCFFEAVSREKFSPCIVYKCGGTSQRKEPVEFSAYLFTQYQEMHSIQEYDSISHVLENFYAVKNNYTRVRQKSSDLRKAVTTLLERSRKKFDLQTKQLRDTQKKDKYRIYGELINTYGYNLEEGIHSFEAINYYTNERIQIPLDKMLSPKENAKKYFDKYNKLKRTFDALSDLTTETKDEILHLESIYAALDIAESEDDFYQIKEELIQYGYMKKKYNNKMDGKHSMEKRKPKGKPFHYISSDGYHIYIGKNNFQNEELTFKLAEGSDWWFHAKGIPGSHVIVKSKKEELPDRTFEEAGRLAAYYSKGRENDKVEIDYVERKHIKKPGGSKPGFVVYYTNYSLTISPDITGIRLVPEA